MIETKTKTAQIIRFPIKPKTAIVRPNGTSQTDYLFTYTVCSDSLEPEKGIKSGDIVICKGNYTERDLADGRVCILKADGKTLAMVLTYHAQGVVFRTDYKELSGKLSDFEITGVIVAFQRNV